MLRLMIPGRHFTVPLKTDSFSKLNAGPSRELRSEITEARGNSIDRKSQKEGKQREERAAGWGAHWRGRGPSAWPCGGRACWTCPRSPGSWRRGSTSRSSPWCPRWRPRRLAGAPRRRRWISPSACGHPPSSGSAPRAAAAVVLIQANDACESRSFRWRRRACFNLNAECPRKNWLIHFGMIILRVRILSEPPRLAYLSGLALLFAFFLFFIFWFTICSTLISHEKNWRSDKERSNILKNK